MTLFKYEVKKEGTDNDAKPPLIALLGLLTELSIKREMAPSKGQMGERKHYK